MSDEESEGGDREDAQYEDRSFNAGFGHLLRLAAWLRRWICGSLRP